MKRIFFIGILLLIYPATVFGVVCSNGATFSNPGPGNSCCFSGTSYSTGELLPELTFACVDGQWYYSGLSGSQNPAPWANDTQMCRKYGGFSSSSTGWFGPYSYTNNDFSSRDKYLMYGDGTNIYCGENKYCNNSGNCVSCGQTGDPCTGQNQTQKTIFGFYFYWYDTGINNNAYKICGTTYNSAYGYYSCNDPNKSAQCGQRSTLEQTPIYGENNYINWNKKDLYKADFIRMKRAGIDVGILVGWPTEPYDEGALPYINVALDELKSEGKSAPKFVLFEALDNWIYKLYPEINFQDPSNRKVLINKIVNRDIAVWNGIKDEYEFTRNNSKILWLFRPPQIYNSKINCLFFDELKQEFINRDYSIFFVGPSSIGNCNSIGAYHNWGQGNITRADQSQATAPDKFISNKIDICEVTPGLERENAKYCAGGYETFENFPLLPRGSGEGFKSSWDYCLNNNEGWIVAQTWNEYFESTNIAPSTRNFTPSNNDPFLMVKINREKTNLFKNINYAWKDCEINEECFIGGVQGQCVNNICISNAGDANNDGHVTGADYIIWVNHYGKPTTLGPGEGDFYPINNPDNIVDGKDYIVWVNNYGN